MRSPGARLWSTVVTALGFQAVLPSSSAFRLWEVWGFRAALPRTKESGRRVLRRLDPFRGISAPMMRAYLTAGDSNAAG